MNQAQKNKKLALEIDKKIEDREKFLLSQNTLERIKKLAYEITPIESISAELNLPYSYFKTHIYGGTPVTNAVLSGERLRMEYENNFISNMRTYCVLKKRLKIPYKKNGEYLEKELLVDIPHYKIYNKAYKTFLSFFDKTSLTFRLMRNEQKNLTN